MKTNGPSGRTRLFRALFVLLGPISLASYLLLHMWLNLTGACYNLVIESSLNRLTRRPIRLATWAVYALSPLIVLLAPVAGLVQALLGLGKWLVATAVRLGRWQTGISSPRIAGVIGTAWFLLAAWIAIACISPRTGWQLIGRSMPGVAAYQRAMDMQLTLGELPEAMQQRRRALIADTPQAREKLAELLAAASQEMRGYGLNPEELGQSPQLLAADLASNDVTLLELAPPIQRYLAGLPWYYEFSTPGEGSGRAIQLFGCLAFAAIALVRWPGMGSIARGGAIGIGQFVVRTALVLAVMVAAFGGWSPEVETKAGQAAIVLVALMVAAVVYWLTWKASLYWRLPRQYSPFLAMRLLQRKRIAFFSLGAVTLCVAMVLIVVSVMGGFLDMVRDRSHHLMGDLIMYSDTTQGFPYYQPFIDQIKTWPEIEAATPVITSFGLLQLPYEKNKPVHIMGIRLDELDAVNNFRTNLYYEEWYPGSTSLKEQAQPLCGADPAGKPVLPAELEAALLKSRKWQEIQKDPGKALKYTRLPEHLFPGPGVYEFNSDPEARDANWMLKPGWGAKRLPGIIIGRDIIADRTESGEYKRWQEYPRGCQVILTLAPMTVSGRLEQNSTPVNKPFLYVDDSRTGVYEVDSTHVYVDFDLLQSLLKMQGGGKRVARADSAGGADDAVPPRLTSIQPRASQVQIRIKAGSDIEKVKAKLSEAWHDLAGRSNVEDADRTLMGYVKIKTWAQAQETFISAVEKEKVLMLILFGVISVVAIFLILCIFYMIVAEKTRDIGIVKSVGGSSGGVAAVFLSYGAAIGVVGAFCGLALGAVFVHYINQIQDWLASLNPELRVWKADVYSFDKIPNVVKLEDALVIGVIAVIAAIVGALVPALIAARKHPVESLRYE